jgi:hypothetical protein
MARFVAARRGVPGVVIAAASSSRIVRRAGSVTIALVLITRAALLVPKVNVARLGIQRLIDSTVSGVSPVDVVAPAAVPVSHVPAFSTAIVAIVFVTEANGPGVTVASVVVISRRTIAVRHVAAFVPAVVISRRTIAVRHVAAFVPAVVLLITEAHAPRLVAGGHVEAEPDRLVPVGIAHVDLLRRGSFLGARIHEVQNILPSPVHWLGGGRCERGLR